MLARVIAVYLDIMSARGGFAGRLGRVDYAIFCVLSFLLHIAALAFDDQVLDWNPEVYGPAYLAVTFAHVIPFFTSSARRLHDTGMSGWWSLFVFVPGLGSILFAFLVSRPPQTDGNRFGRDA